MMNKEIEELIKLFKRLQDQIIFSGIKSLDISLFQNINMMIGTYDMLKYQMPPGKYVEIHESMKKMILKLTAEIKLELGKDITNHKDLDNRIKDIDEMLGNPNISEEDIDKLLDAKLNERQKKEL